MSTNANNRRPSPSRLQRTNHLRENRSRADRYARLSVEPLEGRIVLSNYVVSTTAYSGVGSLAAAIGSIETEPDTTDMITFDLPDNSTISLSLADTSSVTTYGPTAYAITENSTVTIDGSGAPGLKIDGGGEVRPFAVTAASKLTLENLTIADGVAQGGAGGSSEYGGTGGGGAGLGGGVYNDGGSFTAEGVTFTNNEATGGASPELLYGTSSIAGGGGGSVEESGTVGTDGGEGAAGGGGDGGAYQANGGGGGFGGGGGGGGAALGQAGGLGGSGGFGGGGGGGGSYSAAGGDAGWGGGNGHAGANESGGVGGGGGGMGGGIFNSSGSVTLVNDTFTGNSATGGSGSNAGLGYGGAVFSFNGSVAATFDTFSRNTAINGDSSAGDGLDLYVLGVYLVPTATLVDDILGQSSGTEADLDSGSIGEDGGSPTYSGSSNNLVSVNGINGLPTAALISATDPMLGALANNGGYTETMALQAGSPAIAAGTTADFPGTSNPINTDQAGNYRLNSTPDLGSLAYTPPAPTVASLSPNDGPTAGGTSVVIYGTNFTGATAVEFGSTAATSFTVVNATTIDAVDPAGSAGTVDVTVETAGGTSETSSSDDFTYVAAPLVFNVYPFEGPLAGGTLVTVHGFHFTGATAVEFGSTAATSFTVVNDSTIDAVDPAGSAGTVDVTVETAGGTSSADDFTYVAAPTVNMVNPLEGPLAGGTLVTVYGSNFTGATAVDFGSTPGTNLTVVSPTEITVDDPAESAGTVQLTVTTPYGTSSSSPDSTFEYIAAPTIVSLSPNDGPTSGGVTVTIDGTNLENVTGIYFGSTAATSFTVVNATTIDAVDPAGSAGTVDVTVETAGGTSATSSADEFTYISAPTVTSLSPSTGPASGGTSVTITGTDFTGATEVYFGSTAATSFTVVNATTIDAVDPAGSAGTVDVTVETVGGTSETSSADDFTYVASPTLSITPTTLDLGTTPAGTPGAEQSYTISGNNLVSNVLIVAPVGVQVSDDGGITWASTLTEDETEGTLDSTVIEVRLDDTIAGSGSGHIDNDTNGLDSQEVTISGTIAPAAASQFILTGLVGATAGTEQVVTITAEDQYGNVATGYEGTIHFTSTDGQAVLPADATLEDGSGTFDVTLDTVGNQSVTATDIDDPSINGTSTPVPITAAAASQLVITGLAGAVAGTEQVATVTAEDRYGNLATGYGGTVHFTSTDGQAVLPADAALDNGSGTFDVTLDTVGNQSVSVAIVGDPSLNASEVNLLITPASASEFVITSDGSSTPEATVTVTAFDPYGNVATGYEGTIHFTSTDPEASLPADSTLTDGVGNFVITFATSGTKSVTVTDTEIDELTGTGSFAITLAVTGEVYLDLNANGLPNEGEPGLAGRVVFLDLNHDGTLDQGDPTAVTDINGDFTFDVQDASELGDPVIEATSQDLSDRYVVDQTTTNLNGSVDIGVVPYSPIAPIPVIPNPFTASPSPNPDIAYVESLYRAVLGRTGADFEVGTWLARMSSGMTNSAVASAFVNSVEHRQDEVNAYYEEFLHRGPDPLSVLWVNALESGASEESVVEGFLDSAEYQSEHQDSTQFVQDLYTDVLGRVGEGQGVTGWVAALDSGASRAQVVADFVQSVEAIDQVVDSYYTAFLHRPPEVGTSSFWFTVMEDSGASAGEVAAGILTSAEFDQDASTVQVL